jgi:TM2 domain-containing membrane protein YozV
MHSSDEWLSSLQRQRTRSPLNWRTAFVLSLFLGCVGADRFYAGRIGLGLLKLLTFGGCFGWWIADIVLLWQGQMKDDLGRQIRRLGSA